MITLSAPPPFELWLLSLQTMPPADLIACLSNQERERSAKYVFERDRRRYLAAHCGLRQLLAKRTGQQPQALEFDTGEFGKPGLRTAPRCTFNMSHSEDVALVALADADVGEIGVDVEMLRPMPDAAALARQNFSAAENDELSATKPADQALAFLLGWTRKEACLKAIGSGLSIAPNIFTAGLGMGPRSVSIATAAGTTSVWVQSFRHGADVVGSLARIETARR